MNSPKTNPPSTSHTSPPSLPTTSPSRTSHTSPPTSPPFPPPSPPSPPLDLDIYPPTNTPPSPSEGSDIPRLRTTHTTAGYRDGISVSKTSALQPGFDEGYPLGAAFGLRVGYLLGVLEGICGVLGRGRMRDGDDGGVRDGGEEEKEEKKKGEGEEAYEEVRKVWMCARGELAVERVFGREFWDGEGGWRYEVQKEGGGEGEGEITFQEVVEQHPLVRKWVERVRVEMRRWGVREGVFEGEEWERGRVGSGEGE